MCFRSAQNIILGGQHPLLSRMVHHHRILREPDGPPVSTCAGGAPRGQLQLEPERFSALNTNQLQEIHKREKAEQKQKPSQQM